MMLIVVSLVIAIGVVQAQDKCVDLDQKAFNKTNSNLTLTTRDKLSELGYYCDITISWNVSNSTVFNKSKHDEAFAVYQKIYSQSTETSIDGDRKAGVTKDCLAYAYKVVCAHMIPKCSDGKDETLVVETMCGQTLANNCARATIFALTTAMVMFVIVISLL